MEGVGFTTVVNITAAPFVIPPFTPPLLFVSVQILPSFTLKASLAALPRITAKSVPAPKSTPLTPGTENIICDITLSSESKYGSPTKGSESYFKQFADTRYWVKKGWLDYIIPQIYWNFSHAKAPYAALTDWWSDTVSGTRTKLYIGLGAYNLKPGTSGWGNSDELKNQLAQLEGKQKLVNTVMEQAEGQLDDYQIALNNAQADVAALAAELKEAESRAMRFGDSMQTAGDHISA